MPENQESPKKSILKPIQYNSPVILTFALLSFASLLLGYVTDFASTQKFFCVFRSSLTNPLTYLRMFTYVLGHADMAHYVGNFTIILLIGPMLEEKYGGKNLLKMMAITALITAIINMIFFKTALLGASGIAFMLILLSSFANYQKGKIPLTLLLVALIYIGGEVVNGIISTDNISQLAHIVGGICGAFFGRIYAGAKNQ